MNSCYVSFYRFSEDPFRESPNPKFFFASETHREALFSLQYGIKERKGFILLLGHGGLGKTTLINHLISTFDSKVKTAFIPDSRIPYTKLLGVILHQLGVPVKLDLKGSMLHELYFYLITCLEQNENAVIILDEAHLIDESVVEEVRLLANLETPTSKLLQIVLCGEPKLRDKLRADVIRQIGQRIVITCRIDPMTEEESLRYIDHRLKMVGSEYSQVFEDKALAIICKQAKGIPRAINILCSNALSVGADLGEQKISAATVRKIKKDKDLISEKKLRTKIFWIRRRGIIKIFTAVMLVMILVITIFFSRGLVQNVLNRLDIVKSAGQKSPDDEAAKQAMPEATLKTTTPEAATVLAVHERMPLPTPAPVKQADKKIRFKSIAEVTAGANLTSLAFAYYNFSNTTLIDRILEQNPSITDPDLILVKQKIILPEITDAVLIKSSPGSRFNIHLATFISRSSATQYSRKINFNGKEVGITPRKVSGKKTWYRVSIGTYADWEEASRAIIEMKQQGLMSSFQ